MNKMILLKINVTRIQKERLFEGRNGAKYLDCVMMENDKPDEYGNHFVVKQSISREERMSGVKATIIGNAKWANSSPAPVAKPAGGPDGDDNSVPF